MSNKACFLIIFWIVLLYSCSNDQNMIYPVKIIEENLEKQYEAACYEFYLYNLSGGCDCVGVRYSLGRVDTIPVIYADVKLHDVEIKKDTICYSFQFYYKGNPLFYVKSSKNKYPCFSKISLIFLRERNEPIGILEDEALYDLMSPENVELNLEIEKRFIRCVMSARIVNPWLRRYVEKQKKNKVFF